MEEYSSKPVLTKQEQACEEHFTNHFKRNEEGRFIVKLPLKNNDICLGDSFTIAKKRFLSLENKLNKNLSLKNQYSQFINDYIKLGHMKPSSCKDPLNKVVYYFPHHAVLNEKSITTKHRAVFDGSCKTTNGLSLNDHLVVGPNLQKELFSILFNFRCHKFVLTADITKVYRQVLIDASPTNF